MYLRCIIIAGVYFFSLMLPAHAEVEFAYEWDAYYSNVSWTKGFADQKIPVVQNLKELDIYKKIFKDSLKPDFLLFEASVNPLPILGVLLRDANPSFYPNGQAQVF